MFENNIFLNISEYLTYGKIDNKIVENIVDSYKIYCKYNAYEEKNIGYAILFIHLFNQNTDLEAKFKLINILNKALANLDIEMSELVLIRNLVFYSDCIDRSINKMGLKRMLF